MREVFKNQTARSLSTQEGRKGSMKPPFSHAMWLGMFVGLDLIAESYQKSQDYYELQLFLAKYRQTVADFRAAHSEHMEESLKNAGIGRETEGGVMERILGYEAIGNNHGMLTIAHLACGHSRRFEYGYRSPSGTALCWDCPKETGPRFDIYGNRINPDGTLWNLDGKLAARNGND